MTKVAVLLSGQLRDWKTASKIFKLWNYANNEISYDFFLSTWDDSYRGVDSKDADLSMCVASEVILCEDFLLADSEVLKYTHLLKRTNILKNRYEKEQNIKYDVIIATRPDIMLGPRVLEELGRNIKGKYIGQRTLFIHNGITEKLVNPNTNEYGFFMTDFFVYGHSMAVNEFAKMYDDIMDGRLVNRIHITPATHIVNNRINNRVSDGFVAPIRYTNVQLLEDMYNSGALKDLYKSLEDNGFKDKYLIGLEQYDWDLFLDTFTPIMESHKIPIEKNTN
jgi:hypothetical protein